jgi:hypothetical protein
MCNSGAIAFVFQDGDFSIRKYKNLTKDERARQRIRLPNVSMDRLGLLQPVEGPPSFLDITI